MATVHAAPSSAVTSAQEAVIAAIQAKVAQQFSTLLDGEFYPMSMPSGAYYGIQAGPNNYYNKNFLDQVNIQAQQASNGLLEADGAVFTSLYGEVMNAVVFVFSPADSQQLQADLTANQSQVQAVISAWETDTGAAITAAQMQSAFPATKLGYIQGQVESRWKGDARNIPSSLPDFKPAYQSFQVSAQVSNRMTLESAAAINRLSALRANLATPSADDGGLQLDATHWYPPLGPFPTQNSIIGELNSTNRQLTIAIDIDNFSSSSSTFKVEGSVGFTVPIADLAEIGVSANTQYSLSRYADSSTVVNMSLTYPGVTFVSVPLTAGNLTTDNSQGWYAADILQQAIGNTDGHQTGYSLQGGQFPVDRYFGTGKLLSRVKTLVLSREPTITLKFCQGETSNVTSDFHVGASVNLKILDLFQVGSASTDYKVTDVDDKSVAGCVTLTLGPPATVGTTNLADARAYLIGGVPSYPPTNP